MRKVRRKSPVQLLHCLLRNLVPLLSLYLLTLRQWLPRHATFSACSRSSQISSVSSSPTDRRIRPLVTPWAARASAEIFWCVVVSGWVIRLLASPRLFETSISPSALARRKAAALPPSTSNVTTQPP